MSSLWSHEVNLPKFKALEKDINTDVLIIGGGIAGILCAYELKKRNIDCVLVEANEICSGITKNTTAKITSQHGFVYDKITKEYGSGAARLYLESNENALKKYREICENADCDFETRDNIVYSFSEKKIESELEALRDIGFPAQRMEDIPLSFSVMGAIKFRNQAQFNPLKFICEAVKGLNIYEHTKVLKVSTPVITTGGKINAKKIISATHFPLIDSHGLYFMKLYQHRSYVAAVQNAEEVSGMYVDEAKEGLSFRSAGKYLLIGGGGHRTGKNGGGFTELEKFVKEHYPEAEIKYRRATQDCMTLDGIPYIGRYSKNTPDFYVTTGFNKWGMTSAMVGADILADMIEGKQNRYASVYSPSRSLLHPQLFVNSAEAVISLLTPVTKRCPHMGCALKWNEEEHSWDCPCHGSRFEENGNLIDNPSPRDLKKR